MAIESQSDIDALQRIGRALHEEPEHIAGY